MKKYKFIFLILQLFVFQLILVSCNTTEPEETKLALSFEDASCTEVWLKVTGETGKEIQLLRNGNEVKRFTLTTSSMTLYDDSLTLKTSYSYQAVRTDNGEKSTAVAAATLDTTSHNFTWQTFTFGGNAGNCVLYDCAIISDDDIWCVGEIQIKDTSQNGYTIYNAVHWDGDQWNLLQIPVRDFGTLVGIFPLTSIFAFSHNNIWFSSYADLINWSGEKFESKAFFMISAPFNGQVNKIWGSSENSLYCVGNGGAIYLFNGQSWNKIESGTHLEFQDIWGAYDKNGKEQILAVASNKYGTGGQYIVQLIGNSAVHLNDIITPAVSLSGIWFVPDRKYYLVGDGIYTKENLSDNRWQLDSIIYKVRYYPYSISGNGLNDIALCCDGGVRAHFNGINWEVYPGENANVNDNLKTIKMKNNVVLAVGSRYINGINDKAIIYMGRR